MDGTTTPTTGEEEERAAEASTAEQPQLLATAVGDQCANCEAKLAGDQRYCVECGQRRGKSRYSPPGAGTSAGASAASRGARRPRMSSNASLIAGIGVLLLAMGVGVLIGRGSTGTSSQRPGVQVITVTGGAAPAAAATTPTTSSPAATTPTTSSTSKAKNPAAAIASRLPPAAKKIPRKLQSSVAKVGSKCTSGTQGCTNGKFTGTFFGGG